MSDEPRISPSSGGVDDIKSYWFFALLIGLLAAGGPASGLIDIPISFFLKDRLNFSVTEVAAYRFWVVVPIYFSFLFGIGRDLLFRKLLSDRAVIIVFGLATAVCYLVLSLAKISPAVLIAGVMSATLCYLFVAAAWHALISAVGSTQHISGQLSSVWNATGLIVSSVIMLASGAFSDTMNTSSSESKVRLLFLLGALLMVGVASVGALSSSTFGKSLTTGAPNRSFRDLWRLFRYRPVLVALAIWFLWNFAPGTQTVLQYYLTDVHQASGFDWGAYNAIYACSFLPTLLLFGFLSGRLSSNKVLLLATLVGIPQMLPLIWIDSVQSAMLVAIPIGFMGGMAEAAFLALVIRSAPRGLEGTTTMLASSLAMLSSRVGNVFGASIYARYGFVTCAVSAVLVYALILPLLIPASKPSKPFDCDDLDTDVTP